MTPNEKMKYQEERIERMLIELLFQRKIIDKKNVIIRIASIVIFILSILLLTINNVKAQTCFSVTGDNASVIILENAITYDGELAVAGDTVRAFTPAGDCAGRAAVQAANYVITVWGDNIITPAIDGFLDGEPLRFEVTEAATGLVYDQTSATYDACVGCFETGEYHNNAIYVVSDMQTTIQLAIDDFQEEQFSAAVYPNPFRDFLMIRAAGAASLYDVLGRLQWTVDYRPDELYRHDTRKLPGGVYMLVANGKTIPVVKL